MPASQIPGDVAESGNSLALRFRQRLHCAAEAMVEMVADQRLLGFADGFLNRVQLLRDLRTGAARFDHFDDAAQMTICALQPLDDGRMALVGVSGARGCLIHGPCYAPGEDIVKRLRDALVPRVIKPALREPLLSGHDVADPHR